MDKYNYTLRTLDGKTKKMTLKSLYKLVFNKVYCKDTIENLEGEEWREIDGTEGNYYCSNLGRIKSCCGYTAIIIRPYINHSNYAKVKIIQNGLSTGKFVHRLVASKWLPLPQNIDCKIHHIDGNKLNNKANNLIWIPETIHYLIHSIMTKENRILGKEEINNIISTY